MPLVCAADRVGSLAGRSYEATGLESAGAAGATQSILVVAPEPFLEDRGTPIAVYQLVEALSSLGYGVDLLTYPLGRAILLRGVRVFRVPNRFRVRDVLLDSKLAQRLASAAHAYADRYLGRCAFVKSVQELYRCVSGGEVSLSHAD